MLLPVKQQHSSHFRNSTGIQLNTTVSAEEALTEATGDLNTASSNTCKVSFQVGCASASIVVVPSESNFIRCDAPIISVTVINSCKSEKVAGCGPPVFPCSLLNFRTAWKSKQRSREICFKASTRLPLVCSCHLLLKAKRWLFWAGAEFNVSGCDWQRAKGKHSAYCPNGSPTPHKRAPWVPAEGRLPVAWPADGHKSHQHLCGEPRRNTKHTQGRLTTIEMLMFFSVLPNAALWTLGATFHCRSQISAITTCPSFTLTIISFLLLRNRSSTHHGHFLSHPLQFHHLTAPYQSYTQRVAPTALKYPGVCPTLDIFQPCWISND